MPLMEHCIQTRKIPVVILNMLNTEGIMETWLRISGQIYSTLDDYKTLGQVILDLAEDHSSTVDDRHSGFIRKL